MITPFTASNDGLFNTGRTGAAREKAPVRPVKNVSEEPRREQSAPSAPSTPPNVNDDKVTISESGNIDLAMFNYIDKGGDASEALTGGAGEKDAFAPKPNFVGMSVTRYNQMKAEIDRNFASDPDARNQYLQELNKALDDYVMLQAKIAEQLASAKENEAGTEEEKPSPEAQSEEIAKLRELLQVGGKEVKAIINKVLGDSENNMPKELNKAVDDMFIDAYRQRTGSAKRADVVGDGSGTRGKQAWEEISLHINSLE